MRYLVGQAGVIGGSVAVGTGEKAPTVADSRLTYEFDRATIYLTSPDYLNKRIIFKGTLDEGTVGTIHEVGLFSGEYGALNGGSPSKSLATFERDVESWSAGPQFASGNHRIGYEALRFAPAASSSVSSTLEVPLDLSGYTNTDLISLAFHSLNTNTSSVTLRLRGADAAAYYEVVATGITPGYNVVSFEKRLFTKTGVIDFSGIQSIQVAVAAGAGGAAQVDMDGIRVETSGRLEEENVLVSRTVLAAPIVKTDGSTMDVEYALEVAL